MPGTCPAQINELNFILQVLRDILKFQKWADAFGRTGAPFSWRLFHGEAEPRHSLEPSVYTPHLSLSEVSASVQWMAYMKTELRHFIQSYQHDASGINQSVHQQWIRSGNYTCLYKGILKKNEKGQADCTPLKSESHQRNTEWEEPDTEAPQCTVRADVII